MNKILIYLILIVTPIVSFASYDGNPCADYIGDLSQDDFDYLRQKTIYGYVLDTINMKQVDSCAASSDELKVCIKKTGAADWADCSPYTFRNRTSILASSLDNESLKIDLLANLRLNTMSIDEADKLCLTMETIYGQMPLVCKNTPPLYRRAAQIADDAKSCSPSSCAMNVTSSNSQLLFNFSGRMMQCVRESLDGLFFENTLCPSNFQLNNFATVTNYLKKIIFTLLAMYTIFYGIKILLDPEQFKAEEALIFVVKMLLVIYFTVGFQFASIFANKLTMQPQNGITDVLLPLFRSISTDLSQIVLGASRSSSEGIGLCQFDPKSYPKGYSYFAMFDAIDCRIGYFLGYGMLYDSFKNPSKKSDSFPGGGFLLLKVITGLLIGSPVLAIFNILFVYLFLHTLIVRFIGMFMFYTISLYAMFFISPIFIPMALFEKTRDMFDGWLKVTLSFALQPAIVAAFMTMMLTMYDKALYGNCTFIRHTYPYNNSIITTFEPSLPSSDIAKCGESLGYQLYEFYSGSSWSTKSYSFFSAPVLTPNSAFFLASLKALIISFIIYKFASDAQSLAADLTEGVSLKIQESREDSNVQKGGKGVGKGDDKGGKGDDKGGKGGDKGGKGGDKGGGVGDKVSSGKGGGVGDKVSSGKGGNPRAGTPK
jgi:type IV secretion system protein VirB6